MTARDFRAEFETVWERANSAAIASKTSQSAHEEVKRFYSRLDEQSRLLAGTIVSDWLLSDDESRRWDALALIRDFTIRSALPALRALQDALEVSNAPSAPYDWAKVNRLIGYLTTSDSHWTPWGSRRARLWWPPDWINVTRRGGLLP